jgi:hypothetical protein
MIQTITLAEAYLIHHEIEKAGKIICCVQAATGITYQITFPPQRNEIDGWFSVLMISHHGRISVVRMPARRPVYISEHEPIEGHSPDTARSIGNE